MKRKTAENIIKEAQIGFLTKEEYRDFQKKIQSDRILAEKTRQKLLQDSSNEIINGENSEMRLFNL